MAEAVAMFGEENPQEELATLPQCCSKAIAACQCKSNAFANTARCATLAGQNGCCFEFVWFFQPNQSTFFWVLVFKKNRVPVFFFSNRVEV